MKYAASHARFLILLAGSGLVFLLGCTSGSREPANERRPPQDLIFREVSAQTGLIFHHFIGSSGEYFLPEIMGSGVALLDYDSDGDLDVYLLQGTMLDPEQSVEDSRFPPPSASRPGNRLFRNELVPNGGLQFRDVTEEAGVGHRGYSMGVAVGDYDNDGDPDLYVTCVGPNIFYRNDGGGTFSDITRETGADDPRWSTSAAFLDYDRDGYLDLFVANYVDFTIQNNKDCFDASEARDYCSPAVYRPVPDRLFRNEGNGRFRDVSEAAGIVSAFGSGLGVIGADFNSDSWIDIYVANDGNANQLWQNQGDGTFVDVALLSGTAYNAGGEPEAGMGVTAGDFDGDGDDDLFVTHLIRETNTLYLNEGSWVFRDATNGFGLGSASLPYTGFGCQWFDFDGDGWLDLFIANGAVTNMESLRRSSYPFRQPNQLFRGVGEGRFETVTDQAGAALAVADVSRGAAFGDVDNDGDIDIIVSNNNGPARLYLNEIGSAQGWLAVRLEGDRNNRDGIGARLALLRKGRPPLWRRAHTDGSYLSASDVWVHFGLAEAGTDDIEGIGVAWPDGQREVWQNIAPASRTILREGTGTPWLATP